MKAVAGFVEVGRQPVGPLEGVCLSLAVVLALGVVPAAGALVFLLAGALAWMRQGRDHAACRFEGGSVVGGGAMGPAEPARAPGPPGPLANEGDARPPEAAAPSLQVKVYCQAHRMGVQTSGLSLVERRGRAGQAPTEVWSMVSVN